MVYRPAYAECRLLPKAVVPLRAVEGFAVLSASIGSTPVTFLLDTGAQAHLVLPEAQAALHLPVLPGTVPVIGTGGVREAPVVLLEGVQLGLVRLDPAPTPIAPLPAIPQITPMLAGLLGSPLLMRFDFDLDVRAGRLALYEAGACGAAVPALAPRMTAIPLGVTADRAALLQVRINGETLIALLDTGSRATLLTEDAARRLGLGAPVSANTARGVDGELLPVAHLRVREMAVGDDLRRDVPVSISPIQLGGADMLLGLDYLRQRRVWISLVNQLLVIALPSPAPSGR
jgi:predicted aspartyl protease